MKSLQKIIHNFKFFLFTLLALFVLSPKVHSQSNNKIEIVQANLLRYNKNLNPDLRRLIGDVILQHNFTLMYCDSAYYYQNQNKFKAFGKIKVVQGDSLYLTCDSLKFDGNADIAEARNNVKLVNKNVILYTDYLDYNTNTSSGYYNYGGKMINQETELKSKRGIYYAKNKIFYFKDSVIVTNPQYIINSDTLKYNTEIDKVYFLGPTIITSDDNYIYCEYGWYDSRDSTSQFEKNALIKNDEQIIYGDLLYYNQLTSEGKARGNVKMYHFKKNIIAEGHIVDFNREKDIFTITDSAVLVLINNEDSIFIHGDTIKSEFDTTEENRIIKAYHKVKFYREDLQGKCDSMIYNLKDSVIQLHREPVIWAGEYQMTAEYMEAYIVNKMFDRILIKTNAFIISKNDTVKFTQIKGKEMTGFFKNNELYLIEVYGNGQTIYFPKEEENYIGMNKVESSNLTLYVEDRKIKKINFINKPTANITPIDQLEKEFMKLKGFVWFENFRPFTKYDIFKWE